MSRSWIACAFVSIAVVIPQAAGAQPDAVALAPDQRALGCAPSPSVAAPAPTGLRIVGSQDVVPRSTFGSGDMLIVSGGTKAGAVPGQHYYLRRVQSYGGMSRYNNVPHVTQTTGWVHIISANETTAIAEIDHACNVITSGDYLEPFKTPVLPETAVGRHAPLGNLDFSAPGRILFGDDERTTLGIGEYAVTDRGAKAGTAAGMRFAIYRNLRQDGVPLAPVGEAVVVTTADDAAVIRIVRARDAVVSGDLLIPEKK